MVNVKIKIYAISNLIAFLYHVCKQMLVKQVTTSDMQYMIVYCVL